MSQAISLDWRECLKDSPKFRSVVHEHEKDIESFENHLEKVIKYSGLIVEHGKTFQTAYNSFLAAFQSLMVHFKDDPNLLDAIGKFNKTSTNWHSSYQLMIERCYLNVAGVLSNFVKTDIKRVKEVRKAFHKGSEDVDSAFAKNAQVSKSRPGECIEANSHLSICRNHFKKTSLDYVYELNSLQLKKKMQMLSCMSSHYAFQDCFLQHMNDSYAELKPHIGLMDAQLKELDESVTSTKVQMKAEIEAVLDDFFLERSSDLCMHAQPKDVKSHTMDVQRNNPSDVTQQEEESKGGGGVTMEGYLYKRTSSAFKSWVRRWFIVEDNQLLYCSQQRSRDGAVVLEKDLRLCNVVSFEDTERRFCLQVVSPVRSHLLQADNARECRQWIEAIQEAARKAYNRMPTPPPSSKSSSSVDLRSYQQGGVRSQSARVPSGHGVPKYNSHLQEITRVPGNQVCCDCGQSDPKWSSYNFGITLCIECSGIHRSFGVHRSKVRSVTLDAWEDDQVRVMVSLGNRVVNRVFERCVEDASVARATPGCGRDVREAWISEKYIKKSFVRSKQPATKPPATKQPATASSLEATSNGFIPFPATSTTTTTTTNNRLDNDDGVVDDDDQKTPTVENQDAFFEPSNDLQEQDNYSDLPQNVNDWLEREIDGPMTASQLLCKSADEGCLAGMLRCLAEGADVNHVGPDGKTPLIFSLTSGSLAPVEFLLLNGAKVDAVDAEQQSALHHAAHLGNASQICLLLKRKANQHLKNSDKKDALDIAIEKADANVVTLLRLARLNEEMKRSEGGFDNTNDDMFAEVFKDFSCITTSSGGASSSSGAGGASSSAGGGASSSTGGGASSSGNSNVNSVLARTSLLHQSSDSSLYSRNSTHNNNNSNTNTGNINNKNNNKNKHASTSVINTEATRPTSTTPLNNQPPISPKPLPRNSLHANSSPTTTPSITIYSSIPATSTTATTPTPSSLLPTT